MSGAAAEAPRGADSGRIAARFQALKEAGRGGLVTFVEYLNKARGTLHDPPIHVTGEKDQIQVDLALQWTSSYSETLFSFVNNIKTIDGGTHVSGLKAALTRTLNALASAEQKRALLGMMWRVAMADNELSRYEEHLIRKVADLLYVPHSDFIAAKQQAM